MNFPGHLVILCILALVAFVSIILAYPAGGTTTRTKRNGGFKPHFVRQGDGRGAWTLKPAQCQLLRYHERGWSVGFGLAQMDNGEVVLMGICSPHKSLWYGGGEPEKTVISFSKDQGDNWTQFQHIPDVYGRPLMLAELGGGGLTFSSSKRYISNNYGRTWTSVPLQPAANGGPFEKEGNPLVDRDEQGMATRIAEIGFNAVDRPPGAKDFCYGLNRIRWSYDAGRTWKDELAPPNWAASEGSLVRAANGWLIAALRMDTPISYPESFSDEFRSTRVSISKDDGKTWSDPKWLFDGRMHPHLLRMPNGDIVMVVTVRHDLADGQLASYRKGCEAVISHDNGLTWDLDRRYILDEWEFHDSLVPAEGQAGHLYSTLLDNGSILTVHSNYLTMGMTLICWRP